MSKTAFRYELGDARVIKSFVDKVKSVERLKLLLVLTVADIKGVGPEIWNDWKGSLTVSYTHLTLPTTPYV